MTDLSDGWLVYDELEGPELDPERWTTATIPLPEGGDRRPLDPNAEVSVGNGEVRVRIPEFSLYHDVFQPADNVKYLRFSPTAFELPDEGPVTFAVDLAIQNIGGNPTDIRMGMAAMNIVELDDSGRIFDVCGTSTRVFVLHERMLFGREAADVYESAYAVESPFLDFGDDFTSFRTCEVTLDRGSARAEWRVDDKLVYEVDRTDIPPRVHMGFGIFTMMPIRDGASRCRQGQGLEARWRKFRVRGLHR